MNCPKCKSSEIGGLVQAFWVALDETENPTKQLSELVDTETEVGSERTCFDCGHEWGAE